MSVLVRWNDSAMEIRADFNGSVVDESWITELRRLLGNFVAASGVTNLDLEIVGAGPFYTYSFSDATRTWEQSIDSTTPSDPGMTFDVPDYWALSEFAPQRPLREWLVAGINDYQLYDLKVTFL